MRKETTINNEEFEMLGEPRMTMAQFWIEEKLAEEEDERQRAADLETIKTWRRLRIPGDPPTEVEDAIRREQVRLMEE